MSLNNSVKFTYFTHGTTTDNEKGLSTGWAPGELSELGKKQARELKPTQKFDAIFSSDLKRAVDSAQLIFPNQNIISDKRLRECDYGDLTQTPEKKVNYQEYIGQPFPHGESLQDVEKRIQDFLDFLKNNYGDKHIAIVSHKAPQLAFEVLIKNKTWPQAISQDWRNTKQWQPGWEYELKW